MRELHSLPGSSSKAREVQEKVALQFERAGSPRFLLLLFYNFSPKKNIYSMRLSMCEHIVKNTKIVIQIEH